MLSCKEAASLVSQSLDERLPLWKRLQLHVHLWLCRMCRAFATSLRVLREGIRYHLQMGQSPSEFPGEWQLSPASRERIKELVRSQAQSGPA